MDIPGQALGVSAQVRVPSTWSGYKRNARSLRRVSELSVSRVKLARSTLFVAMLCLPALFATAAQRTAEPNTPAADPAFPACSLRGLEPASQAPSEGQLRDAYNMQAQAIRSVRSAARFVATAGPRYGPEADKPREVIGFVLVKRPNWVRIIGQAPGLGQNLFDMASDGHEFHLFIPTRFRFYTGAVDLPPVSTNPFENVRPQHVIDALLWAMVPADAKADVVSDGDGARIRLVLRPRAEARNGTSQIVEFDRVLGVVTQIRLDSANGNPESIIRYADWKPWEAAPGGPGPCFPRHIWIARPGQDYQLELQLTRLALNQDLAFAQFRLDAPRGVPVVRLEAPSSAP